MATRAEIVMDAHKPEVRPHTHFCRPREIDPAWSAAWDALASNAAEPNVFFERWFMEASLQHIAKPDSLRIAFVWNDEGVLIGVTSFFLARRYGRMVLSHVQTWSHYNSFLGAPLIHKDHIETFWATLLTDLDETDWADGLIHLTGLVEGDRVHQGLIAATQRLGRACDTVLRSERAMLRSPLTANAYYETHTRKKKRKEMGRLRSRLDELGQISCTRADTDAAVAAGITDFLALEEAGWKGKAGSAMACTPETDAFMRQIMTGAWKAGKLDLLSLNLNGKPIAMLVNFTALPGTFSYKIAFDESYARFSPGVLLQLENLKILERPGFGWMDSCAVENHAMINSLWAERRAIIRVSIPLGGLKRGMVFRFCRTAEDSWAKLKKFKTGAFSAPIKNEQGHDQASL
jgi:CelD/BcsL family acetyltransferase involved in cellulose biosynthesis